MSKKIHLGSGGKILKKWDNLDRYFDEDMRKNSNCVIWVAPNSIPYKDNTVSFIFTEHFLEHLDEADGFKVLKDCYRVLKPNGVLRICVPSLDKYVELFLNWKEKKGDRNFTNGSQFLNYAIYGESWKNGDRVKYLKKGFKETFLSPAHDHRYLYSEEDLLEKLNYIGFKSSLKVEWGKSKYKELIGLEHHKNLAELIVEAIK